MRFLNRLIKGLIIISVLFASSFVFADETTKGGETVATIFGQQFRSFPTFGSDRFFESKNDAAVIQLKIINVSGDEIAKTFIKNRLILFQSVFEPKRVDYPGQFSRVIECPTEYKPKFFDRNIKDGYLAYYIGFANKNKVSGACTADLIAYKYFYGFVYCNSKKKIYEVEHFSNLTAKTLETFIESISCD
jgi:hypothetical protein